MLSYSKKQSLYQYSGESCSHISALEKTMILTSNISRSTNTQFLSLVNHLQSKHFFKGIFLDFLTSHGEYSHRGVYICIIIYVVYFAFMNFNHFVFDITPYPTPLTDCKSKNLILISSLENLCCVCCDFPNILLCWQGVYCLQEESYWKKERSKRNCR